MERGGGEGEGGGRGRGRGGGGGRGFRPDDRRAPRTVAVKDGRRPPRLQRRVASCVLGMSSSLGVKSPVQPDGGEARVKRKGGTARDRLKEARSEIAT